MCKPASTFRPCLDPGQIKRAADGGGNLGVWSCLGTGAHLLVILTALYLAVEMGNFSPQWRQCRRGPASWAASLARWGQSLPAEPRGFAFLCFFSQRKNTNRTTSPVPLEISQIARGEGTLFPAPPVSGLAVCPLSSPASSLLSNPVVSMVTLPHPASLGGLVPHRVKL